MLETKGVKKGGDRRVADIKELAEVNTRGETRVKVFLQQYLSRLN